MRISIQINIKNGWSNNAPAFHEVKSKDEACAIAYAMSHQFGNVVVRMVYIPDRLPIGLTPTEYVSRLSGEYIQSSESNLRETIEYVNEIVNN